MPKAMTKSEKIVGRRLPNIPRHQDTLMAGFVKSVNDETFCGRMPPNKKWLQPAHRKAKKEGWIEFSGVSFGQGMEIWTLTERGKSVALEAAKKVNEIREARAQWSREFTQKLKENPNAWQEEKE